MQFLPSRWETARVDAKGDGVVNRMDPKDAIPAAARYLEGEVLAVAEAPRRIAKVGRIGPYV